MIDLDEIRRKIVSVDEYLSAIESPYKERFLARKESYQLNQNAVNKLKRMADEYVVMVFSAEWCKDCVTNIPVLELVSKATELEIRVFGHIIKGALGTKEKWRIPPSPPEVKIFWCRETSMDYCLRQEGRRSREDCRKSSVYWFH
jgi:thiol-disulfide isomerase/thioredoxin